MPSTVPVFSSALCMGSTDWRPRRDLLKAGLDCDFSVPRLFLVPEGQHINRIVGRLVAVQRHVAGVPERYDQFAKIDQLG